MSQEEEASPTSSSPPLITEKAQIDSFNRGPITKYWENAESCSQTLSRDAALYYGWGQGGMFDTSCYPMGTKKSTDYVVASNWNLYYYSPAACPPSWHKVTQFESSVVGRQTESQFQLGSDTTALLCCPSGFNYYPSGSGCTSQLRPDQIVPYFFPTTNLAGELLQGKVSTSTIAESSFAHAAGIFVMYQSSDVSILDAATVNPSPSTRQTSTIVSTTGTGTGTGTGSTTPTPTDSTTTTPPAQPATQASSSGLSTGAKIGIGISIPLAALIGLAFGFFLFRRRRPGGHPASATPPGYDEAGMVKYAHVGEMAHAEPVHEAPTTPAELGMVGAKGAPVVHERHELM